MAMPSPFAHNDKGEYKQAAHNHDPQEVVNLGHVPKSGGTPESCGQRVRK